MRKVLLSFASMAFSLGLVAQPAVGSIAILGFQADTPDAFAFVTLQDIAAGDSIIFTDNGWSGTAFFTNEDDLVWKATAAVPAATVITITDPNNTNVPNALIEGPGQVIGKMGGLAVSGDQLFAYVINSGGTQIPIAALSTNAFLATCNATGNGNSNTSCLPSNLTLGQTAIQLSNLTPGGSNPDNGFMNLSSITGSVAELQSIIYNINNWNIGEDPLTTGAGVWPDWNITIGAADPSVVSFNVAAVSVTEGSAAVDVIMAVSPALSIPKNINLQVALSPEFTATDFITSPPHTLGLITVQIPAGVTTFSFSVQAPSADAIEGSEITTIAIVAVDQGLEIGSANTINFAIEEDLNSSFVTFSEDQTNLSVLEGNSVAINVSWSPVNATESSFTLEFSYSNGGSESDINTDPALVQNQINISVPAGQSSVTIDLSVVDDFLLESSENVSISLSNFQGNFNPGQFTTLNITLLDNDVPPPAPPVYINELMAFNNSTIADENGQFSDWIELYNAGTEAIDLAGLFITNEIGVPDKYQFPAGSEETILEPGEFLVLWADENPDAGPLHLNFSLDNEGGFIGLANLIGEIDPVVVVIDSVSYGFLGADTSYARLEDGDLPWLILEATPGASNETVGIEQSESTTVFAYPNPVSDQLRLRFHSAGQAFIQLCTIDGKVVLQQESRELEAQLNVQTLPAGVYLLNVVQGSKQLHTKICVVH